MKNKKTKLILLICLVAIGLMTYFVTEIIRTSNDYSLSLKFDNANEIERKDIVVELLNKNRISFIGEALLLKALKDNNFDVRYRAVEALGKHNVEKIVDNFLVLLNDENIYVVGVAGRMLAKIPNKAIQRLIANHDKIGDPGYMVLMTALLNNKTNVDKLIPTLTKSINVGGRVRQVFTICIIIKHSGISDDKLFLIKQKYQTCSDEEKRAADEIFKYFSFNKIFDLACTTAQSPAITEPTCEPSGNVAFQDEAGGGEVSKSDERPEK